jgi:hypothetical protein
MGRQRPRSVSNAIRVQWALVALAGIATLLTILLRDDLLRAWVDSNATARALVDEGGLEALQDSSISVPAFVPVAVVSFLVYALLAWVLAVLFREGHGWARWSLVALAAAHLFGAVVIYRADPPAAFLPLVALAAVLDLALTWFLLQRDTAEWVRGAALAEQRGRSSHPTS